VSAEADVARRDAQLLGTWPARLALLCLPLLSLLAYGNTFDNEFTIYDPQLFLNNPRVQRLANIPSYFIDPQWGGTSQWGFYRPVAMVTHALDYFWFGQRSGPMRAINMALHGVNGVLVAYLAFRVGRDRVTALLAGAVFVLHPVQTDAVNQIATRSDLLATGFFVLGFLAYLSDRRQPRAWIFRSVLAPLAYGAGLFSKEMAVTLPACLVLHDLLFDRPVQRREWVTRIGPFLAMAIFYAVCRVAVLPGGSVHYFSDESRWVIALTMAKVFAVYLRLLVLPVGLSITYAPNVISTAHSLLEPGVLLALALHAALLALAVSLRRRQPIVTFAIFFLYLTLAPVSHLAVSLPTLAGERFLYPGVFGFALLIGWLGGWVDEGRGRAVTSRASRNLMRGGGVAFAAVYLSLVWLRNREWRTELEIWRSAALTHPNCVQAAYSFGSELAERGRLDEAKLQYERAIALAPRHSHLRFELAIVLQRRGDEAAARGVLEEASRVTPGDPNVERLLGLMLLRAGRDREADAAFARAIAALRGTPGPLLQLAQRLRPLGRFELAARAARYAEAAGAVTQARSFLAELEMHRAARDQAVPAP
jgi:protein O-mannosyl-transferase